MQFRSETAAVGAAMLIFALGCADLPIIGDMMGGGNSNAAFANAAGDKECASNVAGIKTAQVAYYAEFDSYIDAYDWPESEPDSSARAWPTGGGFDTLGWAPDGKVSGTYSTSSHANDFEVRCRHDADGNGQASEWKATKTENATQVTDDGDTGLRKKQSKKSAQKGKKVSPAGSPALKRMSPALKQTSPALERTSPAPDPVTDTAAK